MYMGIHILQHHILNGFEKYNIKIIIIPYNARNLQYYFDKIHALYLPSGGAFASSQENIYKTSKNLIKMAIDINKKGYYFPVWSCCMGFQQMVIIADGKGDINNLLTRFDSLDYMTNIYITPAGRYSRIIKCIRKKTLYEIRKNKITLNNHYLGITPAKFRKKKSIIQIL